MQLEDRTYYEEEQKMEANWMLILILFTSISAIVIAVAFLYNSKAEWLQISLVAGAIIFSDALMVFLFKTMKLELAIVKNGLYFKMFPSTKNHFIDWNDIAALSIRKSPVKGYGKTKKWRYGDVYAMNLKVGLELIFKDGKKKFFSLKHPDEFKKAFRKLELHLQIE